MIVWGVELQDKVTPAAINAAGSMQSAAKQALTLERAMATLQGAMTRAAALGNVAAFQKAAADMHLLEQAAVGARSRAGAFGVAWERVKQKLEARWRIEFDPVEWASTAVSAIEGVVGAVQKLSGAVAEAVADANEARAAFTAFSGGSKEAGDALFEGVSALSKSLPQSEKELRDWSRELLGAGVAANRLSPALQAIAGSEALLGKGAGQATQGLLAKLAEFEEKGTKTKFTFGQLRGTGVSQAEFLKILGMTPANFDAAKKAGKLTGQQISDAIVTAINQKAAGPIAAQMGSLATLSTKATDTLTRLVEKTDLSPLTDAARDFLGVLDDSSPSGQALQLALTTAFHTVAEVAGWALEKIKVGFEYVIIGALEAAIFIKTHWELVKATLIGVGAAVVGILTAAFVSFIPVIYTAAAGVLAATWPFLAIGAAVGLVSVAIYELIKNWDKIGAFFANLIDMAATAGSNLIDGLVNGIISNIGKVIAAATQAGKSAISAVEHALGIASPSKVMFQLGAHTTGGFAAGMAANTNDVADAGADLGGAATAGASRGGAAAGGSAGASVSITVAEGAVVINVPGGTGPINKDEMRALVSEEIASAFEKLALQIGRAA